MHEGICESIKPSTSSSTISKKYLLVKFVMNLDKLHQNCVIGGKREMGGFYFVN